MLRRPSRLAAGLTTATLALGAAVTALTPSAGAAEPGSPLELWAPEKFVAYEYDGQVYTDLALKLIARDAAFEVRAHRTSYDQPITSEWRVGDGPFEQMEPGTMESFQGLTDFVEVSFTRVATGEDAGEVKQTACLTGDSQRVSPDGPATSPYPDFCPYNPYTLGSVMGVQAGHATPIANMGGSALELRRGRYDVVATIAPRYVEMFGIAPEDATVTSRMVVKRETWEEIPRTRADAPVAAAEAPTGPQGRLAPGDPAPDLRSLPAWNIGLNRKGTVLRFAANVWNAGNSPLVIDGFRNAEDPDVLDTYQYFFDAEGEQKGYQEVGTMHWHAQNHNHWHFEDFARYRLLNEDMSQAVLSTKQSFCLANTDAVDYTVEGADWHPEGTDLSTACGGRDSLSVRQVLSSGSGDTYLQYRYGQAFPIADLPNGTYWIAVEANPLGDLVESDTTNNTSYREIEIRGKGDRRRVVVPPVGIIDETVDWRF